MKKAIAIILTTYMLALPVHALGSFSTDEWTAECVYMSEQILSAMLSIEDLQSAVERGDYLSAKMLHYYANLWLMAREAEKSYNQFMNRQTYSYYADTLKKVDKTYQLLYSDLNDMYKSFLDGEATGEEFFALVKGVYESAQNTEK